ncbi:MAG: PSP1 domain-containing protein [Spirochaeta sp.]
MSSEHANEYAVKLLHSHESGIVSVPSEQVYVPGDHCIVGTSFGRDIGRIIGVPKNQDDLDQMPEWTYHRPAEPEDFAKRESNIPREKEAMRICRELIDSHGLAMNLVAAHYVLLDPRLLFYFTAENRVDFRALITDLIPHFKTRIELRQVGVRDESRFIGGLGICGRPFCCNSVNDRMKPVSIKMAKTQNIPVSSSKISGACGRLLCCLNFEYEAYAEESKRFPNPGARLMHEGERCVVCDVNILAKRITVIGEEGGRRNLPGCSLRYDPASHRWSSVECSCSNCGQQNAALSQNLPVLKS